MLLKQRTKIAGAVLLASVFLGGCAQLGTSAGSSYSRSEAQRVQRVQTGTLIGAREVSLRGDSTGVGTLGGAALGGMAGSNVGNGHGRVAGAIAGVIIGGIAGRAAEGAMVNTTGVEYTVELDPEFGGGVIAIMQEDDIAAPIGSRVRILTSGSTARVSK